MGLGGSQEGLRRRPELGWRASGVSEREGATRAYCKQRWGDFTDSQREPANPILQRVSGKGNRKTISKYLLGGLDCVFRAEKRPDSRAWREARWQKDWVLELESAGPCHEGKKQGLRRPLVSSAAVA